MEGVILGVDAGSGEIAINTTNGERYYCHPNEWKGAFGPEIGMRVDFENQPEARANRVYPIGKTIVQAVSSKPAKTKTAATLFALFLGGVGGHKFYLGAWGWGILYILFCWTYIPFLLAIIELVRYITLSDDDFQNKYAKLSGSPFDFLW